MRKIRIAVDDTNDFIEFLKEFNAIYRTDFEFIATDFLDGVEFVYLNYEKAILDHIFLLGYSFAGFRSRKGYL